MLDGPSTPARVRGVDDRHTGAMDLVEEDHLVKVTPKSCGDELAVGQHRCLLIADMETKVEAVPRGPRVTTAPGGDQRLDAKAAQLVEPEEVEAATRGELSHVGSSDRSR